MTHLDLLEDAWGIIVNAGGGDWTKETKAWQVAAADFRKRYHAALAAAIPTPRINDSERISSGSAKYGWPQIDWRLISVEDRGARVLITVEQTETYFTKGSMLKSLFDFGDDIISEQTVTTRQFIGSGKVWKRFPSFREIYSGGDWLERIYEVFRYEESTRRLPRIVDC